MASIRSTQDMTQGRLGKQILFFSIPLILSYLLQVFFNLADIAVVGRFAGAAALGSVGSTATLVTLFTGFLTGVAGGINVLVARAIGARDKDGLREYVHTAAILSLLIGLTLSVLGIVFTRNILELLGTKEELIDGAVLYLRIYLLSVPANALYNFGHAVLSAAGDTRRPLYYLSISGAVNVVLNLLLVIVFHMDVAGVAIASVVSICLSAVLILAALFSDHADYALRLSDLRMNLRKAREILALGIPGGMQNAIFAIANLFVQAGVNTFDAVVVEGNSAAMNSDPLVYDVMAAFYTACASFMGQNLGAKKKDRILKSYLIALAYSFGAGLLIGGMLVLFGRQFLGLFTTEAAVIEAGLSRLTIMGLSYCISAFMDCTIAASRGLGKGFWPTVIVILGSCVFRVIWIYTIFAWVGTMQSLYLLYCCSWSLTGIAEIAYFARIYRKTAKELDAATV